MTLGLGLILAVALVAPAASSQVRPAAPPSTPPSTSEVDPTNAPPPETAPLELDEPTTVTLITGDTVTVHPGGVVEPKPGPGRDDIAFDEQHAGNQIRVVPSDAVQLLAEGKLDERLFDVSYLIREGYDDASRGDMPLIIEGDSGQVRDVAADTATRVDHESRTLKVSAVAQDKKKDKGRLWAHITGSQRAASTLPAGIAKVWLDGMSHVTLDKSAAQIGAPELWDAGYTGDGVTVAVLDTGVDDAHPDLAGQVTAAQALIETPGEGMFAVEDDAVGYVHLIGAQPVPQEGASDPLVHVGRACVDSEGDELLADPDGATALIARSQDVCGFDEKFDAVIDAGATGVVIYNDDPGLFNGQLVDAEHSDAAWGAIISDTDGAALRDMLEDGKEVALGYTDEPLRSDRFGHGTHVASTIAGTGVASDGSRKGVAPDAKIISGKVCDNSGRCQESSVIAGMEWAAHNGADVINLSLGGCCTDGTDPQAQAVNSLTESHDVLFVISAGNRGAWGPWVVGTPGVADSALTVGAVDRDDSLAYFSSRGPRLADHAVKPEVTAPGMAIVAARAAGTATSSAVDGDYVAMSGTSMASPHVAGAAALLSQARPDLDAMDLKDALASTTIDGGYLWYEQGTGRVDVARAADQGIYADASVNVGEFSEGDKPAEKTITYTNTTDRTAVLRVETSATSVGGGQQSSDVILSRKRVVVVRRHSEATLDVIIDPQAVEHGAGSYGGVVTATGRGVSLRTAVGFGVEQTEPPLAPNWDEDWTATYHHSDGEWPGWPNGMRLKDSVMSPDGTTIFLTGDQVEAGDGAKITTAAVDATTGKEIWVAHHPVSDMSYVPFSAGLAMSPDGNTVFVTQDTWDAENQRRDSVILAYNSAEPESDGDPVLGELLWKSSYDDVGGTQGRAPAGGMRIAVTPDSSTLLLLVTKLRPDFTFEIVTTAYDSTTGDQRWSATHGVVGLGYAGFDIAVSPTGEMAYVSGFEQQEAGVVDVSPVTIAYSLTAGSEGEQQWIARHDSTTGNYGSWHNSVSVDGKRVFATHTVRISTVPHDERMETLAYDAMTGELLWSAQFGAVEHGYSPGHTQPSRYSRGAIAVSPTNDLVFIAGKHCEGVSCPGRKTTAMLAYDQMTGELVWSQLEQVQGSGRPDSKDFLRWPVVSPDGRRVYASGSVGPIGATEQLTLAYDTATGQRIGVARHDYGGNQEGLKTLISPGGDTIYTATWAYPADGFSFWALAAYSSPISVTTHAYRSRGDWLVDLTWSGSAADRVDVYRDDVQIATVDNIGAHTDDLGKQPKGATFMYRVCAAGTATCSTDVTVDTG